MFASFQEILASAGVDDEAKPHAGMIVPLGGWNFVRLAGGADLRVPPVVPLKIVELPGIMALALIEVASTFSKLPRSLKPTAMFSDRYFKVSGARAGSAEVKAFKKGSSIPEAVLEVAVLRQKKVKLSIRPVQVRNSQGQWVFHSKIGFDANAMVEQMNSIWTPQANVVFELVSPAPVQIDDDAEIARILDLKQEKASLPQRVVFPHFADLFSRLKEPKADLTMFLVERCGDGGKLDAPYKNALDVAGTTDAERGISLISDARRALPDLLAHEAGHFIGSFRTARGQFVRFGHMGGTRDLMQNGGSATARIPFNDVISYFNPP